MNRTRTRIMVSGGFDPLHVGHMRMIQHCAKLGDVVVALNTDNWLLAKKGYVFMPYDQRKEILLGVKGVVEVVYANDIGDMSCLRALGIRRPDVFANGGDRTPTNTPEVEYCLKNGIGLLFNAGGGKIASSSEIVKDAKQITRSSQDDEGSMQ